MKKNAHRPKNQPAVLAPPTTPKSKRWLLVALCLVVAGGTWALFEFVIWNTLPAELVGKWVVTSGPQEGATFDFYRSGKLIGHVNVDGDLEILLASVRVEDGKIYSTTRSRKSGATMTKVQSIRSLTAELLVVEDQSGNRMVMRRAH